MDKSILISIQPQHVVKILGGKKTLEIRKTFPKGFKGWVYIYCTKSKNYIYKTAFDSQKYILRPFTFDGTGFLNGKVVARFCLDNLITLQKDEAFDEYGDFFGTDSKRNYYFGEDIKTQSCLESKEIENYWTNGSLFAWCINKLEIFDEPLSLSDFYKDNHYPNGEIMSPHICTPSVFDYDDDYQNCLKTFEVTRAPQSWQYVWRNEQ